MEDTAKVIQQQWHHRDMQTRGPPRWPSYFLHVLWLPCHALASPSTGRPEPHSAREMQGLCHRKGGMGPGRADPVTGDRSQQSQEGLGHSSRGEKCSFLDAARKVAFGWASSRIHRCTVGMSICPWKQETHTYVLPSCCFFCVCQLDLSTIPRKIVTVLKVDVYVYRVVWVFFSSVSILFLMDSIWDSVTYNRPGGPQTC